MYISQYRPAPPRLQTSEHFHVRKSLKNDGLGKGKALIRNRTVIWNFVLLRPPAENSCSRTYETNCINVFCRRQAVGAPTTSDDALHIKYNMESTTSSDPTVDSSTHFHWTTPVFKWTTPTEGAAGGPASALRFRQDDSAEENDGRRS